MRNKKGFTLIELLVVISIIAVLMAIMMPALGKAKAQAERIVCNSHLKDLGNLIGIYAYDNDGKMVSGFPYGSRWYDLLGDYYGGLNKTSGVSGSRYDIEIFKCPVEWKKHKKNLKNGIGNGDPEGIAALSMYGYNGFFACPISDPPANVASFPYYWYSRMSKIYMPQNLPLFWDRSSDFSLRPSGAASNTGFNGYPHMSLYKEGWDSGNIRSTKDTAGGPAVNHPGTINAVFADGHAQSNGLWMYADTLNSPKEPDYYWSYFHPTRAKHPKTTIGDAWPCGSGDSNCRAK